jgi:hypothetical protein
MSNESFTGLCTRRIVIGQRIDVACNICGHLMSFHQPLVPQNALDGCLMCQLGRQAVIYREPREDGDAGSRWHMQIPGVGDAYALTLSQLFDAGQALVDSKEM